MQHWIVKTWTFSSDKIVKKFELIGLNSIDLTSISKLNYKVIKLRKMITKLNNYTCFLHNSFSSSISYKYKVKSGIDETATKKSDFGENASFWYSIFAAPKKHQV